MSVDCAMQTKERTAVKLHNSETTKKIAKKTGLLTLSVLRLVLRGVMIFPDELKTVLRRHLWHVLTSTSWVA